MRNPFRRVIGRSCGIVFGRPENRLNYTSDGKGFGAHWLPEFIQHWIVHGWNWTACLFGKCHRTLCNINLDPKRTRCVNCCRRLVATEQERAYAVENERLSEEAWAKHRASRSIAAPLPDREAKAGSDNSNGGGS